MKLIYLEPPNNFHTLNKRSRCLFDEKWYISCIWTLERPEYIFQIKTKLWRSLAHAQSHELPQSHCGDNQAHCFHDNIYLYIYIYIYNMQNNFTWYLTFQAGRPTIFSQVQRSLKISSVMVFCIVFFPEYYNALILSTL